MTSDEGRSIIDSSIAAPFYYFRSVSLASHYFIPLMIIILEAGAPNFSQRYVTARVSIRYIVFYVSRV